MENIWSEIALLAVGWALGVFVHELGHAGFGRLVGLRIRKISIGGGPALLRLRFGETRLEFSAFPSSGRVTPYLILPYRRLPLVIFIAGGAIANLAMAGCLAGLQRAVDRHSDWTGALELLTFMQVAVLLFAIWPRVSSPEDGGRSDSILIVDTLRTSSQGVAEYEAMHLRRLRAYWDGAGEAPGFTPAYCRIAALVEQPLSDDPEIRADQLDECDRELARAHRPCERLLMLDGLVTRLLLAGGRTEFGRLDRWSAEGLLLRPDLPAVRGSRGGVLVAMGRTTEGYALLAGARCADPFNRLLVDAFRALAEFRLGNSAVADDALARARAAAEEAQLNPMSEAARLIERIAREIGQLPSTQATTTPATEGAPPDWLFVSARAATVS